MCGDYSSGCGRGPVGGGITVVAKEDYDNILKDAEKTVNDVCNKADLRKKWIEGLPIENKDIKNMCGNFCDLTEKRCKYESNCKSKTSFDIYDRNANPGDDWRWNGGGCGAWDKGKWELKPQWMRFRDQTEKDPKSTATVIEKEEFDRLMKEAEETVNNISFKSDNAVDDEHKRYEEYCNLSQKRSRKIINDLKTCENEGCKFCEFGPELCERFEAFDLMVGPQKCKHWQNKYSGEKYDKTPKVVTPEDLKKAEKEANKELENIEQAKDIEKQTIEHLQKGSANILRNTYEKVAKGVGLNESYEEYMNRVHRKIVKDPVKQLEDELYKEIDDAREKSILDTLYKLGKENLEKDTSYKHITDEEILEQLKKNAVDNIMAKLSGQVIDLVDDAMKTVELDFQRSKEVRNAYEDACSQSNQAITDWKKEREAMEKPDFAYQYPHEWSLKIKNELGMRDKPDFMQQWVNEMMEKQAKQTNISVVNEMLHQKEQFIKFLKECLKLDTYSDFMYKIENEIKSQENEINFYNSYLEQFYKNN